MKQICNKKIEDYIKEVENNKEKIGLDKSYMLIAHLAALNSTDPHSVTGACIVSKDNELISIGWNEMPFPGNFPWNREGNEEDTKYPYVVHAERMAIHNALLDGKLDKLKDSSIYVSLFPCNQCMQQVIMYDLKALYYDSDRYHNAAFSEEARRMIDEFNKYRENGFTCKQIMVEPNKVQEYKEAYSRNLSKKN